MSFDERTIAQSIVVVKRMCEARGEMPLAVELVEGTSAENDAWRQEAVKYLIAKSQRRIYKPDVRNLDEEIFEDEPRRSH